MATQQPPQRRRPPAPPARPVFDLRQLPLDPSRLKLPQLAAIGFVVGVLFHACVIFAVLDDGSGGGGASTSPNVGATVESGTKPQATPTVSKTADRTDCNAIRGTDYHSENERQWFIRNCTGT